MLTNMGKGLNYSRHHICVFFKIDYKLSKIRKSRLKINLTQKLKTKSENYILKSGISKKYVVTVIMDRCVVSKTMFWFISQVYFVPIRSNPNLILSSMCRNPQQDFEVIQRDTHWSNPFCGNSSPQFSKSGHCFRSVGLKVKSVASYFILSGLPGSFEGEGFFLGCNSITDRVPNTISSFC